MTTRPAEYLEPAEIVTRLQTACGTPFADVRHNAWPEGAKGHLSRSIWIRLAREDLKPALRALTRIHYPHLGVISGCDIGDAVELLYHMYIYYGDHQRELLVTLAVPVPKSDLRIPTITDLIPGALTSEREKQEMLGVEVTDIPDGRRLFLPDDFPTDVFPWRKDERGVPEHMIKQLWQAGRPPEWDAATGDMVKPGDAGTTSAAPE